MTFGKVPLLRARRARMLKERAWAIMLMSLGRPLSCSPRRLPSLSSSSTSAIVAGLAAPGPCTTRKAFVPPSCQPRQAVMQGLLPLSQESHTSQAVNVFMASMGTHIGH